MYSSLIDPNLLIAKDSQALLVNGYRKPNLKTSNDPIRRINNTKPTLFIFSAPAPCSPKFFDNDLMGFSKDQLLSQLQELVSFIFNEVPEDYHFCKLFPYTLAGKVARWIKKLPPGSFKTWKGIMNAFLNNFFYDVAANLEIERESILRYQIDDRTIAKRDEYHGSEEPSRGEQEVYLGDFCN
ncbi:hypothetical protein F2Q69_00046105 [Brassica cretica]|uniref:Retrotransposon gag domain-containing protein n=1 Tax=Brassica cretica TaxID=69181 RepID=A0A8S9PT82_BRACR|nr:hypothetical protein F2Q69_00046105 [Brassica cretica]